MVNAVKPGERMKRYRLLALALVVTTLLPIGIHTVLLDDLGVPYPAGLPRTGWTVVPDHVLLVFALIWLEALLQRGNLTKIGVGLVVFLSAAAINQALLRLPIMRNAVSTKWTIYPFVDNLPAVLWFAIAAAAAVLVGRSVGSRARMLFAAVMIAVLLDRVVAPAIDAAFAPVLAANGSREGDQLYNVPYDWHVDLPSYLTYAEPAVAALVVAMMLRRLRVAPGRIVALLFALQGGPLFRVFINLWYAPSSSTSAILSEGQFALEALALAACAAAFAVLLADQRQVAAGSSSQA